MSTTAHHTSHSRASVRVHKTDEMGGEVII